MYDIEFYKMMPISDGLRQRIDARVMNGHYSDAIVTAFKFLTSNIRDVSGGEGDGAKLVGTAFGGQSPQIRLNKLLSASDKDEQAGYEQLIRGLYLGVRNPRAHDEVEDNIEFCIKIIMIIDMVIDKVSNRVVDFDIEPTIIKILDSNFVMKKDYIDSILADVPRNYLLAIFTRLFSERRTIDDDRLSLVIKSIYKRMAVEDIEEATRIIGIEIMNYNKEDGPFVRIVRHVRPMQWKCLQNQARLIAEEKIIDSLKKGSYDFYTGGVKKGILGTWCISFGRYMDRKKEVSDTLIRLLGQDWYTQNYVAAYFLMIMIFIVDERDVDEACDKMAYALMTNQAKLLRQKFLELCGNYPDSWKEKLRASIQSRVDDDEEYADRALRALSIKN